MHRVLLFLSLFPILAALVLRKLNADRVLRVSQDTRLSKTGNQLARLMLDASGHRDATIRTSKRAWAGAAVTGLQQSNIALEEAAKSLGTQAMLFLGISILGAFTILGKRGGSIFRM